MSITYDAYVMKRSCIGTHQNVVKPIYLYLSVCSCVCVYVCTGFGASSSLADGACKILKKDKKYQWRPWKFALYTPRSLYTIDIEYRYIAL